MHILSVFHFLIYLSYHDVVSVLISSPAPKLEGYLGGPSSSFSFIFWQMNIDVLVIIGSAQLTDVNLIKICLEELKN